jgi:hypothetical protein
MKRLAVSNQSCNAVVDEVHECQGNGCAKYNEGSGEGSVKFRGAEQGRERVTRVNSDVVKGCSEE